MTGPFRQRAAAAIGWAIREFLHSLISAIAAVLAAWLVHSWFRF